MTEYQDFADKYWPKAPGEREQEIYHQYRVERKTQKKIGTLHGITQGRVSQIVRQVEQYGMVGIHLQHSLPEEKLRAKTIQRDQVAHAQQLAMEAFLKHSEPETQLSRIEETDGEGKVKRGRNVRTSKRGKPDGKMLDRYVALGEKLAQLDIEVAELRLEVHDLLSIQPDWKEDHDAHFAIQIREELQRYSDLCKKLDRPCPELPQEEKSETEEWTRHERRENPNGDVWHCIHPKWVKVAKMVFTPHLDPDEPMPPNWGELKPSTVMKKAYPDAPPQAQPQDGSTPIGKFGYPVGSYWDVWHTQNEAGMHTNKGNEPPPGGDGVTYPDGSWEIPNGMIGGGPPGQKSMAQQVKEMREARGW